MKKIIGILIMTLLITLIFSSVNAFNIKSNLDQSQELISEVVWLQGGEWQEAITRGKNITGVDLNIGRYTGNPGPITVEIHQPFGTMIGSQTLPGNVIPDNTRDWVSFNSLTALDLDETEKIFIVVNVNPADEYAWSGSGGNPYPNGTSSEGAPWDFAFRTYVDDFVDTYPLEIVSVSGGFGITFIIRNNGASESMEDVWHLRLTGPIIILGANQEGTIPSIGAGNEVVITTDLVLGLGLIGVEVQMDEKGWSSFGPAILIGPFVLGL